MRKTNYQISDFGPNFISFGQPKERFDKSRNKMRKETTVILECMHCKKHFNITAGNAKRIQQKCCSLNCAKRLVEDFPGGNEKHPLYPRWLSMHQRINNPKCTNYKNYGKRGIKITPDFNQFKTYVAYVTSLPEYSKDKLDKLTLDRKDNDKDYTYGNLRWVNRSIQIINQRRRSKIMYSPYLGVTHIKARNRWGASVTYKGKQWRKSFFKTPEDAAKARNEYIIKHKLPNKLSNI